MSENERNKSLSTVADRIAGVYSKNDRQPQEIVAEILDDFVEQTDRGDRGRILDVGCGIGNYTMTMAERFPEMDVTGMDLSSEMIERAKSNVRENLSFLTGDAEHMPVEDQAFDLVTFYNSWHLMPRGGNVLSELKRVLRADGLVMIIGIEKDLLIEEIFHQYLPNFHEDECGRHYSLEELQSLFEREGFSMLSHKRYSYRNVVGTLEEALAFVKTKPFFGLNMLSEERFQSDVACFAHWLETEKPEMVYKNGVTTAVIFRNEGVETWDSG